MQNWRIHYFRNIPANRNNITEG